MNNSGKILNLGTKYCIDNACLPIKIYHGHVASIKDNCDCLIVPRIIKVYEREYMCPKLCGLPEMIKANIPNLPKIIEAPLNFNTKNGLYRWSLYIGRDLDKSFIEINKSFNKAYVAQQDVKIGFNETDYENKVALLGHPYNIYDEFINMNIKNKLNELKTGVITEEYVEEELMKKHTNKLVNKPFWSFIHENYGADACFLSNNNIDGLIYISSFPCGIDSVIIELLNQINKKVPILILQFDENTGEKGIKTRIEAFIDSIESRKKIIMKKKYK